MIARHWLYQEKPIDEGIFEIVHRLLCSCDRDSDHTEVLYEYDTEE